MPLTCNTADAPTLVRYTFDGDWAARELVERRRELIRAGQLTSQSAVLFDLRLGTSVPHLADLDHEVHSASAGAIWPACRAFLVTTQNQYEVARQLQALLGSQSVINEIFHNESDALEWLAALAGRTRTPTPA
jgi:hypothetical protein